MVRHWITLCISSGPSDTTNPMPNGYLSLAEYPAVMARFECAKCWCSGKYRKTTPIGKYGRDIALPDLLHLVGASCPKMDTLGNDPCGVRYRVLAKLESGHRASAFRPTADVRTAGWKGQKLTQRGNPPSRHRFQKTARSVTAVTPQRPEV